MYSLYSYEYKQIFNMYMRIKYTHIIRMSLVTYENFVNVLTPLIGTIISYSMSETPQPYFGAGIKNHHSIYSKVDHRGNIRLLSATNVPIVSAFKKRTSFIYGYLTLGFNRDSFYLYIFMPRTVNPFLSVIDKNNMRKIKLENVRTITEEERVQLLKDFTEGRTYTFNAVKPSDPLYEEILNRLKE